MNVSMEEQASKLFDKLQSVFGYTSDMREKDVKTIAEALMDVSVSAILADNRPISLMDEKEILRFNAAIDKGKRSVAVKKLALLADRPHAHRFWEITEVAKEAASLLTAIDNQPTL